MKRLALAAAVLAFATACSSGDGGTDAAPTRTVDVTMTDIAFSPTALTVAKGETVEFRFRNDGKLKHDAFIGTPAEQAEHEKEMNGGGHGGHGGDDGITVEAGQTGTLKHTFDEAGTTEIGCHEPGHYGAGMKITVTVTG
jgi:uncharacterized cupredoxin-like copper-binding protein